MKNKPFVVIFLLLCQFGFTQTEKLIQGKVIYDDFPLQGIEVINLVTEKTTKTDATGRFSILAKAEDMLVFVSEKYDYKRLFLDKEFLAKNNFTIALTRKPEQLEEVVIVTKIAFPHIGFNQEYADKSNLEKAANNLKPIGVYDGTIVNGADFMRIGGMILDLFVKQKKTATKVIPEIKFNELATATYTKDYFNNTLKLKPEEVALFLEFCDADPKSKKIIEDNNPLTLMDFLFTKNTELKKKQTPEKQEHEKAAKIGGSK